MSGLLSYVRSGFTVVPVVILVFIADVLISKDYSAPIAAFIRAPCCDPNDHFADLFAASGVAVAFVLAYLASLAALASPGRELLSGVLWRMREVAPDLAGIDAEMRLTQEQFGRIEEFLDDTLRLASRHPSVWDALQRVKHIVGLASRPERAEKSRHKLMELGYSNFRARFLTSFVFQKDAEKCHLLRATIVAAIVFVYTAAVDCLYILGYIENSVVLPFGYLILAVVGARSAIALALRMWPHNVRDDAISPIVDFLVQSMRTKEDQAVGDLDGVVARAKRAQTIPGQPTPVVTDDMIGAGHGQLTAALRAGSSEVLRDVYTAMYRAGPRQGRT